MLYHNCRLFFKANTGAGTDILVNSANNDMSLSKSVLLTFCGGVNDGKNNSTKALQHIMDFIKTNNYTNINFNVSPCIFKFNN